MNVPLTAISQGKTGTGSIHTSNCVNVIYTGAPVTLIPRRTQQPRTHNRRHHLGCNAPLSPTSQAHPLPHPQPLPLPTDPLMLASALNLSLFTSELLPTQRQKSLRPKQPIVQLKAKHWVPECSLKSATLEPELQRKDYRELEDGGGRTQNLEEG